MQKEADQFKDKCSNALNNYYFKIYYGKES